MKEMKLYQRNGYAYFWDRNIRLWTVYPIGKDGLRIEHDEKGDPIECEYFPNRDALNKFLNRNSIFK